MDTPKRIKTSLSSQQYVSSPPSGGSGNPATMFGPSSFPGTPGSDSKQFHQYGSASSGGGVLGWPPESLTSPVSACGSPPSGSWKSHHHSGGGLNASGSSSAEKLENKRGRPRSEALTTLMVEGSISPSAIKCRYCNRVFPREKSLQAHLRTHTGERPYQCDYPGCTRAFTQSGQLKTHQRLHTGERPFICSAVNCQMRFTHANRHCPDHPYDTLKRCDDFVIQSIPEQNSEVLKWLEKYRLEREDRTPTRKTPKRSANHHHGGGSASQNENENRSGPTNNENYAGSAFQSPITPRSPFKSRKGLMCELDMNAGLGLAASPITAKSKPNVPKLIQWQEPTSQEEDESGDECAVAGNGVGGPPTRFTFNPKKRWLRDAWQEDLAKPLEPSIITPQVLSSTTSTAALKQQLNQSTEPQTTTTIPPNPNQMRPTVLMVASKDTARPLNEPPIETNRKLQGALALMQLATEDSAAFVGQYPTDLLATTKEKPTPPPPPPTIQQRIPQMLSYRPGEIDHSIPFTLAAEAYVNYQ
ncbi:metal regulatory transcription factor 1-like [Culex pipiens pallens]|uniref:metal regulatory transcription factor 1-like n=1 Tax=Culex pipiens pallens TaxID=42434 RepID=UPI00195344D1|nr:metal regulatory transcription factor 1-like [Culex pipiens pallens]